MSSPGAEHPLAGVNEVKDKAEQVEVVAGDPPVKVAAAAVLNHPCVILKTTLPLVIGSVVAVVNARVKVPVVVAPEPGRQQQRQQWYRYRWHCHRL